MEKLRRRKQRPKMNLFQRRWCDLSEAAVDDDGVYNEMTIKRTRRKKEEDHRCRCTIELQSIYCRHALSLSYFILVFCLVFLTVACISHTFSATFWSGMLQGGARAVVASPAADLPPSVIAEFSSTLTQKERGKLLKRFGAGKVKCLVCGLVAKDSSDSFLFQRDLFFSDLVRRWESSLKAFVQRCYKKSCSLRFNNVFFKICTSNF